MNHETRNDGAEKCAGDAAPGPVSERKRQANRENAKKSTGPKTARGKRNSSFNAVKHGLLVQRINVQTDEDLERLNQLATGLYDRYEFDGGIRNELLLELALVDYWRTRVVLTPKLLRSQACFRHTAGIRRPRRISFGTKRRIAVP